SPAAATAQESTAGKFHWRPPSLMHERNGRGRATRASIDRTNDGLSGMPAEGTSACRQNKRDFGTSRWGGLKVGYITTRLGERGMTACGQRGIAKTPRFLMITAATITHHHVVPGFPR